MGSALLQLAGKAKKRTGFKPQGGDGIELKEKKVAEEERQILAKKGVRVFYERERECVLAALA